MPFYPDNEKKGGYICETNLERLVYEHTGLNLLQINELNYDEYLALARDAFIYRLNQSQSGHEYLEKCWMMEQTKPDRNALREKFKRKEG